MALAEEARTRPPWVLERTGQNRYVIRHEGHETAYRVAVRGGFLMERVERDWVGPTEAISFLAARTGDDEDQQVTVIWYWKPEGGEPQEWRHDFP